MASIKLTASALRDISQAAAWEDEREEGLGTRLKVDVARRLDALRVTPALGSFLYDNVRGTATGTFQYMLHYLYDEVKDVVTITRIFHTSREPFW